MERKIELMAHELGITADSLLANSASEEEAETLGLLMLLMRRNPQSPTLKKIKHLLSKPI